MSDKTFTVAGTSKKDGKLAYRFANGTAAARARVLSDHEDLKLFDLPRAMTKEAAIAWLAKQGIAAEIPESKRLAVLIKVNKVPRAARKTETVAEAEITRKEIAHEALGRTAHKAGVLSFRDWDDLHITVRQEICRNAAWAAGIATPRGTYHELEAMLRKDGVEVLADGTLREAA
jgi:hypothetical protein